MYPGLQRSGSEECIHCNAGLWVQTAIQGRHKTVIRPLMRKVSTLWPQSVPKWKKKSSCQSEHESGLSELPVFSPPRHAHRWTLVTSSPMSQDASKWNTAGHVVQVLLAEYHTVIGTFICPPVVREGMSNNRLTHTTGTLERPQQLWAAFHVEAE